MDGWFASLLAALVALLFCGDVSRAAAAEQAGPKKESVAGELLPTGTRITPTAARSSTFQTLVPYPDTNPGFAAGAAVEIKTSPDGTTLLVLTSGFNLSFDREGKRELTSEYVFVFGVAGGAPVRGQVIAVPNAFNGLAWRSDGKGFYVSGGVDDSVRAFRLEGDRFVADGEPIKLGHAAGNGITVKPMAAGIAVSPVGDRLLVANFQNDSVSLVDPTARRVIVEQDLRPGKVDAAAAGVPGGEYPFSVAFVSDTKAYVTSQRDREVVSLAIGPDKIAVGKRIKLNGQPTKMILNKDRSRLFVAADNSDTVVVIDAADGDVLAEIRTAAPASIFPNRTGLRGASPNNLALSPDERTLFVTNGGLNTVAVIALGRDVLKDDDRKASRPGGKDAEDDDDDDAAKLAAKSRVIGLIPTGWYPNAVALGGDGRNLYVVNGKSNAGPNPGGCRDTLATTAGSGTPCRSRNQYIWQLSKAGLLAMPMPSATELARLTLQAAANNNFPMTKARRDAGVMAFLRRRIHHVVYIVKENRTYDQVLGDLERGNGDPRLVLLPEPISPNHHALARNFVTLDNFFDSGESSNTGWLWSTAARTTDYTEKTGPVNYAGRGSQYDQEGTNRDVNVGIATLDERRAANPATPNDPDLMAGSADVAAPDPSMASGGPAGTGYLWDAALRAGFTLRNYGFYGDLARYDAKDATRIPQAHEPFTEKLQVFFPTKASLAPHTDPYFRGFDMEFADFWRLREWQREFAEQVAQKRMPSLTLLRLPHDHFGSFGNANDGVNTVETQMADNDYAVGQVVESIANSPFKSDTLIFIVEDDAQNGADHVDAHRSIAFVIGPYVKQQALISTRYTTVSMLRTIEDILGLPPLGLNDGLAEPMSDVFTRGNAAWSYKALVPPVLRTTKLPLPVPEPTKGSMLDAAGCFSTPRHDAQWWEAAMAGQDFREEDRLDTASFNKALWSGLLGEGTEPPAASAADLRSRRPARIAAWRKAQGCSAAGTE